MEEAEKMSVLLRFPEDISNHQVAQCFLMWVTCSVSVSGAFFERFSARRALIDLPAGFLCSCLCGDLSGINYLSPWGGDHL
jgi:hypothetical protein